MKLNPLAGAAPFAHLLGFRAKKAKEEDHDDEDREDDGKEEKRGKRVRRASEPTEPDPGEKDKEEEEDEKNASAAEDDPDPDDEDARAEDDERGDDDGDDEDEDDDEEEMRGRSRNARVRRRERSRCRAIFASPHATGRPQVAASLAFDSTLTRKQALKTLANLAAAEGAAPKRRGSGLAEAMARVATPRVSTGAPAADHSIAARILAAGRRRRGEAA